MWSFLVDLLNPNPPARSVMLVDTNRNNPSRHYTVHPRRLLCVLVLAAVCVVLIIGSVMAFTPIYTIIPNYRVTETYNNAHILLTRLAGLEDSLAAQELYLANLRYVLTGSADSVLTIASLPTEESLPNASIPVNSNLEPKSDSWADHQQPAWPITHLPVHPARSRTAISDDQHYLPSLQLPALTPVTGFFSRGFDAHTGHYAIDISTEEGSPVRAIGDGYVILADWTQKGGYSIAVQHADGFVSVYKHNARLLKRVADHVSLRETIAVSGNSGEYTTGPHLHFELWNNGLAQDPRSYLLGLSEVLPAHHAGTRKTYAEGLK